MRIKDVGALPEEEFLGLILPTIPKPPSAFFLWMTEEENEVRMRSLFATIEAMLLDANILTGMSKKDRLTVFTRMSRIVYSELKNARFYSVSA